MELHFPQSLVRFPGDRPADSSGVQTVAEEPAPAEDPPAAVLELPAGEAVAPVKRSGRLWLAWVALLLGVFVVGNALMWIWDHSLQAAPPAPVAPKPYPAKPSPPPVQTAAQPKPAPLRAHRAPPRRPKPGTTKTECIRVLLDPSQDVCQQVPQ